MRKYELKEQPKPRPYKTCIKMECDICGLSSESNDWSQESHSIQNVDVSCELGESYPPDRYTETHSYDICPKCFRDKLAPWIESHRNAEPRVTESDW